MFPLTKISMVNRNQRMRTLTGTQFPMVWIILGLSYIVEDTSQTGTDRPSWTGYRQDTGEPITVSHDDPNWFV